jgi:integrase
VSKISIINNNGSIRLRFTFEGERHSFNTSGAFGEAQAMGKANLLGRRIELDIEDGSFDETLVRYRPAKPEKLKPCENNLLSLWERFLEYKAPQCAASTMMFQYRTFTSYIRQLPTHDLKKAYEIRAWVLQHVPIESAKRFLVRLSACCDWAVSAALIKANPFLGMAKGVKRPKSKGDRDEINPFTSEERDSILAAMKGDRFSSKFARVKHSFYYPLCFFLFHTGARFSEAAGLQWRHIKPGYILFEQAAIATEDGLSIRSGLKTQAQRSFPCNERMQRFLKEHKPVGAMPEDLVFPSPQGCFMASNNYRVRVWTPVLKGLGLEYRKPYQSRHTFITMMLENGLDAKDVARLVGNTSGVIYNFYAGGKRDLEVPEV